MKKNYTDIVEHYENCLLEHGDNHLGVDWPNEDDAFIRYDVMLGLIRNKDEKNSLLDFGCGTGHLLQHILDNEIENIYYSGLDISPLFVQKAKDKFPDANFYKIDILEENNVLTTFDYIIMNGVFTEKRSMSQEDMWDYFCKTITKVFAISNKGIAFNVMSKNVDWERDDLFHLSVDQLTKFLCEKLSRNFVIRNDYGLYEYTVYLLK